MLDAGANLPRPKGCKPFLVAFAALVSALAACGGGDGDDGRIVAGPGFTFSAPGAWDVELRGRSGSASPEAGATAFVSVRVFRLARPYRPGLWNDVVPELDRVAAELAEQLGGRIDASATVVVAGRRAKRYDIRYERDGREIVERTAFVLKARREFQLVCRYEAGDEDEGPRACAMLFSTLRLV